MRGHYTFTVFGAEDESREWMSTVEAIVGAPLLRLSYSWSPILLSLYFLLFIHGLISIGCVVELRCCKSFTLNSFAEGQNAMFLALDPQTETLTSVCPLFCFL